MIENLPDDLELADEKVLGMLEPAFPEVWAKCYPRMYKGSTCGDFCSPKEPAHQMLAIIAKIESGVFGDSEAVEIVWVSTLAQYRVPMYWVTKEILSAVQHTTPPFSVEWDKLHLPYEAMVFMLPKGVIVHGDAGVGECSFISYCRRRKGDPIPSLAPHGPRLWVPEQSGFTLIAKAGGYLLHWHFPQNDIPVIDLKSPNELIQKLDGYAQHGDGPTDVDLTPNDSKVMAQAIHYVFGLILLINSRPELVERGQRLKQLSKGSPRELWSPYVVGKNYKIRYVHSDGSLGGHHASPRMHWVRGFYKQQPFGPQHSYRKEMWIEPYVRGVHDDE